MYTFKRSVVVYTTGPGGLQLFDVKNVLLNRYQEYFKEVFVVIHDDMYDATIALHYSDYQTEWDSFNGLIQEWLDTKSTSVLITYKDFPGEKYKHATFYDMQYEWFTPLPGDIERASDDQAMFTPYDSPDVRMVKTTGPGKPDYHNLNKFTLWLVNSHFVRSIATDDDIYLLNAGKHYQVNNNTHFCAINFFGVSEVNTYSIKEEDIIFEEEAGSIHLKVKIKESIKNKTVWMVIGGRLYMSDVIQTTGGPAVTIRIEKVDWFNKIFTSRLFIDLNQILPAEQKIAPDGFFRSKAFFVSLLKDRSSFFVVLSNPYVTATTLPIYNYNYPFTYLTDHEEQLPLLLANGLIPKYQKRKFVNSLLLDIDAGMQYKYIYPVEGNNGRPFHCGAAAFGHPRRYNQGYLLDIKSL